MGTIGVIAGTVATLAAAVLAGFGLLQATLRVLEATVPKPASAGSVTEISEFTRRSTGPLAASAVELERAA